MNFLPTATSLALDYGLESFPLAPGTKDQPLVKGWPKQATGERQQLTEWGARWPDANVAVHCKGLLVLDPDGEAGAQSLAALEAKYGKLPATLTSITRKGRHLIYRVPAGHPGVGNSAGKLGLHLDVRGDNGYICAPGSVVNGKHYRFEADVPIAEAPQWLLDLCGTPREKQNTGEPVADASDTVLENARTWLAKREPAIEGQGGDSWTFQTAAGLRDLGVSERQCFELMAGEWNDRCKPEWSLNELRAKARGAFSYGQNEPGARVALPGDFDTVAPQPEADKTKTEARRKPQMVRMADLRADAITRQPWLVEHYFQPGTLVCVFGEPGEGKSVLCGDLAHAVASERPWLGQFRTQRGATLYIALEGYGSMQRRLLALRQQYGDAPVVLATGRFNLATKEGQQELAALVTAAIEAVGPLALIVVDTWARVVALAGANENSASDVGRIADVLEHLAQRTGATIAVIHHSGKSTALGARGSNALLGAVQSEIEIANKTIWTRKQRDADEHQAVGFNLVPVTIGTDAEDAPVTAPLVQPGAPAGKEARLPPQAQTAREALAEVTPGNAPADGKTWKAAFVSREWPDEAPSDDTLKKAWKRVTKALRDAGIAVKTADGRWARALREPGAERHG